MQALRALILAGEQFRHAVAGEFGVATGDTVALGHLASGPRSPNELARLLGLTPSTVTSLLDRLESAGLATRERHATDRRKSVVKLTAAGQQIVAWSQQRLARALGQVADAYGPLAADVMFTLADALTAQVAPPTNGQ